MDALNAVVSAINNVLWSYVLIVVLVGCGIWFTLSTRFVQLRMLPEMIRLLTEGIGHKTEGDAISSFQAFCVSTASRVGVGNIAGVAIAIVTGGPGAVFWMWVSGCLGMSTKACEIILGQRFRVKYSESMDEYMCDRSFVMRNALGWRKGAFLLAIACFTLGPWTCSVQTESVVGALREAFGIDPLWSAAFLGLTCFVTIFGGLRRISAVMERVVPIMALLYILGGLAILVQHLPQVPETLELIVRQ